MLQVGTNSYMFFLQTTKRAFTGRHKIKGHNFLPSFRLHDQGETKLKQAVWV